MQRTGTTFRWLALTTTLAIVGSHAHAQRLSERSAVITSSSARRTIPTGSGLRRDGGGRPVSSDHHHLPGSHGARHQSGDGRTGRTVDVGNAGVVACQNNPTLLQARSQIQGELGKAVQAGLWPNPTLNYVQEQIGVGGTPASSSGARCPSGSSRTKARPEPRQVSRPRSGRRMACVGAAVPCAQRHPRPLLPRPGQPRIGARFTANCSRAPKTTCSPPASDTTWARPRGPRCIWPTSRYNGQTGFARRERLPRVVRGPDGVGRRRFAVGPVGDAAGRRHDTHRLAGRARASGGRVASASGGTQQTGKRPDHDASRNRPSQCRTSWSKAARVTTSSRGNVASARSSVEVPIFDWNQGTIRQAEADYARQQGEVRRIELILKQELSRVYRDYLTALQLATNYAEVILPEARSAYELQLRSYKDEPDCLVRSASHAGGILHVAGRIHPQFDRLAGVGSTDRADFCSTAA